MKHLKTFEENKSSVKLKPCDRFKPGDIVKYKFSNSQPFEILYWNKSNNQYKVKDLSRIENPNTFFKSNQIVIYPPEKLEDWYMNQKAKKYNL